MRHIFWIHSHITLLATCSIIQHKKIQGHNVTLLIAERYKNGLPEQISEKYKTKHITNHKVWNRSIIAILKPIQRFKWIHALLNGHLMNIYPLLLVGFTKFHLYLPQDRSSLLKRLLFLPHCLNYFYIEEGTASYTESSFSKSIELNAKTITRLFFPQYSLFKGDGLYNHYPKHIGAYGFSKSVKFRKRDIIIMQKLPDSSLNLKSRTNRTIFVFDGLSFLNIVKFHDYIELLENIFVSLPDVHIEFKFHPNQDHEVISSIEKVINRNINSYEIISENRILEIEIMNSNITMYGMISSLLFYNKIFSNSISRSFLPELKTMITTNDVVNISAFEELLLNMGVELVNLKKQDVTRKLQS